MCSAEKHFVINAINHDEFLATNLSVAVCGYFRNIINQANRKQCEQNIIIYCCQGEGVVILEEKHYHITGGDIMILPKDKAHCYYADLNNPWEIYWAHFYGEVDFYLEQIHGVIAHIGYQHEIIAWFNEMLSLYSANMKKIDAIKLNHCFSLLMCNICAIVEESAQKCVLIEKAKALLADTSKKYTLQELGEQLSVSKYHLAREFKRHTDQTIVEYQNNLKIIKACELLLDYNKNIVEISKDLCFSTPYYFTTVFKNITGMSPSKYKKTFHIMD